MICRENQTFVVDGVSCRIADKRGSDSVGWLAGHSSLSVRALFFRLVIFCGRRRRWDLGLEAYVMIPHSQAERDDIPEDVHNEVDHIGQEIFTWKEIDLHHVHDSSCKEGSRVHDEDCLDPPLFVFQVVREVEFQVDEQGYDRDCQATRN